MSNWDCYLRAVGEQSFLSYIRHFPKESLDELFLEFMRGKDLIERDRQELSDEESDNPLYDWTMWGIDGEIED